MTQRGLHAERGVQMEESQRALDFLGKVDNIIEVQKAKHCDLKT
jgi:hypothetical protein